MDSLATAVFGLLVSTVSVAATLLLQRVTRSHSKKLVVTKASGGVEEISVPASAGEVEIASAVRSALAFEAEISEVLKSIAQGSVEMTAQSARAVDFVVTVAGKKMAVEVKTNLDRLTREQIERYMRAEPDLQRLVLVSRQPVPDRVLSQAEELTQSGQLAFVEVSQGETPDQLESALRTSLRLGSV